MAKIIKKQAITTLELAIQNKDHIDEVLEQSFNNVVKVGNEFSSNGNICITFTHDVEIDIAKY